MPFPDAPDPVLPQRKPGLGDLGSGQAATLAVGIGAGTVKTECFLTGEDLAADRAATSLARQGCLEVH